MECFERAIAAAQNSDQKSRVLLELAAMQDSRNLREDAIATLERLLALGPATQWHVTAAERLGRMCQARGQLDRALRAYEALEKLPEADAHMVQQALGGKMRVLQQMGDPERAEVVARLLVEQYPDSPYATMAGGVRIEAALARGDTQTAGELAKQEAAREGGDPSVLLRVAGAMEQAGQPGGAIELVERFLHFRPGNPGALEMAYRLHAQAGTLEAYERQLTQAAAQAGEDAAPLRRLADLHARRGEAEKALSVLERLLALQPADPGVLAEAGRMALAAGRGDRAVTYYEKAAELHPEDERLQLDLGDLYAELGDTTRAVAAWRRGTGYIPGDMNTARRLGRHLLSRGLFGEAVDTYLEARKVSGEPGALAAELGEAYEAMLLIEEAVAEYAAAMGPDGGMGRYAQRRLERLAMDEAVRPELISALAAIAGDADAPEGILIALAVAYLRAGDSQAARETFGRISDAGERGLALVEAAEGMARAGRAGPAADLYAFALEASLPPALRAQVALRLAATHSEAGAWRVAVHVLDGALEQCGSAVPVDTVALALADVLVLQGGDFQRAAELYAQVADGTADAAVREQAAWGLADCLLVAGRYEEAIAAFRSLPTMEVFPEQLQAPVPGAIPQIEVFYPAPEAASGRPLGRDYAALRIAEALFRAGRFDQAKQAFADLAGDYPDSPYRNDALDRLLLLSTEFTGESPAEARYVQAVAQVDRGELRPAIASLDLISSLGDEEPLGDDAALLKADALARFGDRDEAVEAYLSIPETFADSALSPRALLGAGGLRAGTEEGRGAAVAIYRRLQSEYPHSPEAQQARLRVEDLLRG